MREQLRDKERLQHIKMTIDVLIANKDRHTLEETIADPIVYFGLVKHVEIIGEAVYMLLKESDSKHR